MDDGRNPDAISRGQVGGSKGVHSRAFKINGRRAFGHSQEGGAGAMESALGGTPLGFCQALFLKVKRKVEYHLHRSRWIAKIVEIIDIAL